MRTPSGVVTLVLIQAGAVTPAPAQPPSDQRAIRWETAGLAAAGLIVLFAIDDPVRGALQAHRSSGLDDLAERVRPLGEWPFYAGLPAALLASGWLAGDEGLARAGLETAKAGLATMAVVTIIKRGLGRARPLCECGPVSFGPMGAGRSLPSGHTAAAFAVATALAERTADGWARVGLYSAASLVGWSRLNDNKHWLSDVVAGALVGTASARLTGGRWRLGRASRPQVHLGPDWTSIGWVLAF
jgi:membrane-associated phospholipid phosphatase